MSYLVMARRWRPRTFGEVVGQEHVTRTLQRAIQRGRVAHAYIFTGPRGVGKTTTARLLAMAVNDPDPVTDEHGLPEPNLESEVIRDIASGNAMDVIEIDGASNNKVEDVRQLRESIKYAPASLRKKVYIIDEVHMLSGPAFNALLKTLEEPPDHAMFIFATTEIHKVPATVLSRCQRFDFKRISTREIRSQLERIVQGDELDVTDEALASIAEKAEGALRDALSVLDQLVAFQGDEPITGDVVRQALGLIGSEVYFRTTGMAATGKVSEALAIAEAIAGGGHDPREFLRGLQRHVLRLLLLKAGGRPEELDVSEEDRKRYAEAVGALDDEDLLRIGEWAAEAEDLLREALDPMVRLELLLIRIARMDRAVALGALLQKLGVEPGSFRQDVVREGEGSNGGPEGKARSSARHDTARGADTPEANPAESGETPVAHEHAAPPAAAEPAEPVTRARPDPAPPREEDAGPEPPEDYGAAEPEGMMEPPAPEPGPSPQRRPRPGPPATEPPEATDEEDDEDDEDASLESGEDGQLSLADVRAGWLELCDRVNAHRRTLGVHLEQGAPTAIENGALEITFEPEQKFEHDQVFKHRDLIARTLREHFGTGRRLVVRHGSVPDALRPPKRVTEGEKRREAFKKLLEENPTWRELVKRLDLKPLNG